MTGPRIDIDLSKIEHNTRALVDRLRPAGIRVTGVTKAALGSPSVGAAMLRGGADGLGDSRLQNFARLAELTELDGSTSRTLIRSPMLSQAGEVVAGTTSSLNTEARVLTALNVAAAHRRRVHDVILMVELGDLREGIAAADVSEAVRHVLGCPWLRLVGLGANLACQNGVVPTEQNMGVLSDLVDRVEKTHGLHLTTISGGNSANLQWACATSDTGRINDLRLGEAILLGLDPSDRSPIPGLHLDAFRLSAEIIEVAVKPARPWGRRAQAAYGTPPPLPPLTGHGKVRQAILALGRQDIDPEGLQPPEGVTILGTSSDHLVLDLGDLPGAVGDEITFGLGYGALLRAMTSPFIAKEAVPSVPVSPAVPTFILRPERTSADAGRRARLLLASGA